jgi:hypothetical protein
MDFYAKVAGECNSRSFTAFRMTITGYWRWSQVRVERNSRFPTRMTEREARARSEADPLRG